MKFKKPAIALLFFFTTCTTNTDIHPDFTRLPSDEEIDYSVDITNNNTVFSNFFDPKNLFQSAIIGEGTDLENEFSRRPVKFDIDNEGFIYVAHKEQMSIFVYSAQGELIYKIGRQGYGPGEFRTIEDFVFDKNYQNLYVLDVTEIEVFSLGENGRFVYETSFLHKFMRPYTMCIMDNFLFVSGYKIVDSELEALDKGDKRRAEVLLAPPITRINLNSLEHINSFGYVYPSNSGWGGFTGRLSETIIDCNPHTQTVVGYLKHFPFIFGYNIEGHQKWISRLDNYRSVTFEETNTPDGPSFYGYTNEEYFHFKFPIQSIYQDEFSLLQFINNPPQPIYSNTSEVPEPPYHTVLVDTNSGELFYSDYYPYIGVKKNSKVVTVHQQDDLHPYQFHINEIGAEK